MERDDRYLVLNHKLINNQLDHEDVSQSYDYLEKIKQEKLKRMKINIDRQFKNYAHSIKENMKYYEDGKNAGVLIRYPVVREVDLKVDGKVVDVYKKPYYLNTNIIDTYQEDQLTHCPNCGALTPSEGLINGCPYCGSKFHYEDFKEKINLTLLIRSVDFKFKGIPTIAWFIVIALVALGIVFKDVKIEGIPIPGFGLFYIGAVILITILSMLIQPLRIKHYKEQEQAKNDEMYLQKPFIDKIRVYDEHFSMDLFDSWLFYILNLVYLSNSRQEYELFLNKKITLNVPQNVVECNLIKLVGTDFSVEGDYQYIDCIVDVELLLVENNKIKEIIKHLKIKLVKDKESVSELVNSKVLYTCPSCGANIDIAKGGECQYCHNKIDLKKNVWIIENIEEQV